MDSTTDWLALVIAVVGLGVGLYQYSINSCNEERARRRDRAINAADELEKFHADESVSLALNMMDYGSICIASPNRFGLTSAPFKATPDMVRLALQHHSVREALIEDVEKEKFLDHELILRAIFDEFLIRLDRMQNLISNNVVDSRDFRELFSYWLELIGEHPQPTDQVNHFDDARRRTLWEYIRRYQFDGVVRLFERYGRASPVRTEPDKAFRPRQPTSQTSAA